MDYVLTVNPFAALAFIIFVIAVFLFGAAIILEDARLLLFMIPAFIIFLFVSSASLNVERSGTLVDKEATIVQVNTSGEAVLDDGTVIHLDSPELGKKVKVWCLETEDDVCAVDDGDLPESLRDSYNEKHPIFFEGYAFEMSISRK